MYSGEGLPAVEVQPPVGPARRPTTLRLCMLRLAGRCGQEQVRNAARTKALTIAALPGALQRYDGYVLHRERHPSMHAWGWTGVGRLGPRRCEAFGARLGQLADKAGECRKRELRPLGWWSMGGLPPQTNLWSAITHRSHSAALADCSNGARLPGGAPGYRNERY